MDGSPYPWLEIISQCASAALAALGFGLIFQVPRRHISAGSAVGSAGWCVYLGFAWILGRPFWGTFAAALTVGVASQVLARVYREAALVFSVPAIIPLVPGTTAYWACLALLEGRLPDAVLLAADTLKYALGIAGGLSCAAYGVRILAASIEMGYAK